MILAPFRRTLSASLYLPCCINHLGDSSNDLNNKIWNIISFWFWLLNICYVINVIYESILDLQTFILNVMKHTVIFWEFINKLIEIFQWIMVSMMPFVAITAFICWFAMNCLVLIREINIITILQPSNFNVF